MCNCNRTSFTFKKCVFSLTLFRLIHQYFYFFQGLDEPMAKHFAHLYIRDPLTLFSEKIDLDDKESSDHFEVR